MTHELALQMIVQCLGVVFGRPQDVEEWFSWGPDTWITDEDGIRHGDHLDRYLKKTFDELDENPTDDLFGVLNEAEIAGRALTRKEKYGMANLVLAGGRDTVVKLMSGSLWHLANNKEHLNKWLSFISANQDSSVIENPEEIRLDRGANPHLGFGYGRHSCIGMHLAQLETKIVLEEWLARFTNWEVLSDSELFFDFEEYKFIPSRFHNLHLKLNT
ncbi:MAG: cytochrome P450 [Actinobacteria bacterium]|nr:cytochrome P450 [Actinomycetota bacterium]